MSKTINYERLRGRVAFGQKVSLVSIIFQEFCLDLYQPSGAGRRRRRRDLSTPGGEVFLVKSEELVKRESKRNFFPIRTTEASSNGNEEKKNSAKFGDNVGVTVILPGGECENTESTLKYIAIINFFFERFLFIASLPFCEISIAI